jgi:hypothetical protein
VTEVPLAGGYDAGLAPVRVGDTVRRLPRPFSPSVRALLRHLEAVGFDGAPRHLGVDERGREILSYLDGEVPRPPYPDWAMTDRALVDLGGLLRRFHEASASFPPDAPGTTGWADFWSDPRGGSVVCHNDVFPENVVFRGGRVVALIDFDMAAPGDPLWDLAIAAELWAPLGDPAVRTDHPPGLDGIARLGLLAAAYGLEPERAEALLDTLVRERAHSTGRIRSAVAAGDPDWTRRWAESGGDRRGAADDAWIYRNRAALVAAARR